MAGAVRAARERPSFALYLAALALFPFNWLSPFSYEQAGWTDVFILAATAVWVVEKARSLGSLRLRPSHYAYAAYLAAGALSMFFVTGIETVAARNVAIMVELVAVALLTADFARRRTGRVAIAHVVLGVTFVAAAQGTIGLLLYYTTDSTLFVDSVSGYFETSDLYTRVDAGFYGPALLGSFCIFASAVLALPDAALPPRARRAGQVMLAALVLLTLSRAVLGFALAAVIRWAYVRGTTGARRLAAGFAVGIILVMAALTVAPLSLDPVRPASASVDINPRLATLRSSAESFAEDPLLGKGPGSVTGEWNGTEYRAHFTPLNVAATVGLLALAALIALVVILWRSRGRPTNLAVWSGMAGLGLDALGQDVEHFRHLWVMLGLADADRRD